MNSPTCDVRQVALRGGGNCTRVPNSTSTCPICGYDMAHGGWPKHGREQEALREVAADLARDLATDHPSDLETGLTAQGWQRVEELRRAHVASRFAFPPMPPTSAWDASWILRRLAYFFINPLNFDHDLLSHINDFPTSNRGADAARK